MPSTKVRVLNGSVFRQIVRMSPIGPVMVLRGDEDVPEEDCSTAPHLYTHDYIRGKCVTCGAPQPQEEIFMETEPHE